MTVTYDEMSCDKAGAIDMTVLVISLYKIFLTETFRR